MNRRDEHGSSLQSNLSSSLPRAISHLPYDAAHFSQPQSTVLFTPKNLLQQRRRSADGFFSDHEDYSRSSAYYNATQHGLISTIVAHAQYDKKVVLYKTEMCRSFEETGTCKYGAKCQFAHDPLEIRSIPRHPRYKTEICKTFWQLGNCPYGKRCCFIHTENELRNSQSNTEPKSATREDYSSLFEMDKAEHSEDSALSMGLDSMQISGSNSPAEAHERNHPGIVSQGRRRSIIEDRLEGRNDFGTNGQQSNPRLATEPFSSISLAPGGKNIWRTDIRLVGESSPKRENAIDGEDEFESAESSGSSSVTMHSIRAQQFLADMISLLDE